MQKDTCHMSAPSNADRTHRLGQSPEPPAQSARTSSRTAVPPAVLMRQEEGVRVGPSHATRREFAAAASATMAAFLAGSKMRSAWADDASASDDATEEAPEDDQASEVSDDVLPTVDADGNVNIINTFEDLIESTTYEPAASYTLPVGCNVYADCETRAAVVQANQGARPFTVVGCLDYATGEYTVVIPQPITGSDYAPSEARCTETLMAWVEVNNATDAWVLYAVPFGGQIIDANSPGLVKLAEGDGEWLPAQFDVAGTTVVWQVMPDPSGSYVTSYSHAYLWTLGAYEGTEVYESPGRFACEPNISAGILTIAPRIKPDQGVYYGLKAIDLDHGRTIVDEQEMPISVRPFRATRIGDTFAFSVEANYGYGGLLGNMGYYIGRGGGPFDYVAREPSAQVNYVGGRYIVKSQLSYFVIDLERKTYARIAAASGCVDYGDYPATAGTVSQFVTYTAVKDSSTGIPNSVLVRLFTLA